MIADASDEKGETMEDLSDRAALGERLSPEECAALAAWEQSDPRGIAEGSLWTALQDIDGLIDGPSDPLGDRRLADAAVARALAERASAAPSRVGRRRTWAVVCGGGVLAAAAALALLVGTEKSPPTAVLHQESSAVLVHASGAVAADGVDAAQGARVARGTELHVRGGVACLQLETAMYVCLADGARARLTALGGKERRVDLIAGRVAVGLASLPAGERLSIVAGSTWSTAVGTAFTVERLADGRVQTVVHEGKVRVGGDGSGTLVPSHKIGLAQGTDVELADVRDHAATETSDWVALGNLAGRSVEGPMPVPVPAGEAAAGAALVPAPAAERSPRPPASEVREGASQRTADDILSAARQALRDQRWADAAGAYASLTAEHPSSPEARTALVPLAGLEIDRLGQAEKGLRHLEAYLSAPGPLAAEARAAKIRALRTLGRPVEEAQAIEDFVAAHPNALDVPRLNERLQTLRAR